MEVEEAAQEMHKGICIDKQMLESSTGQMIFLGHKLTIKGLIHPDKPRATAEMLPPMDASGAHDIVV